MIEHLTHDVFVRLVNTTFRFRRDNAVVEATLVKVTPSKHGGADNVGFSLLFQSVTTEGYLPQGISTLEHPELPATELFMVPVGPSSGGMRYEIILN